MPKIGETRRAQPKLPSYKANQCIACSGTGKSSKGGSCHPCGGTGKRGGVTNSSPYAKGKS